MVVPIGAISFAQAPKTSTPVAVQAVKPLKSFSDSVSYAMGMQVASFYKQRGLKNINTALISKAMNDVLTGKALLMDGYAADMCMNKAVTQAQESQTKPAIEAGRKYLVDNSKKPGIKTTASGLQYEVLTEGTGPKPTAADNVVCNYKGTLINGTEFDNSFKRGQPATFPLSGVIRGWTEALQLMPVGSKYRLFIPYELGYGLQGNPPSIPGGSTLIFEVELLEIKK